MPETKTIPPDVAVAPPKFSVPVIIPLLDGLNESVINLSSFLKDLVK